MTQIANLEQFGKACDEGKSFEVIVKGEKYILMPERMNISDILTYIREGKLFYTEETN